MGRGVTMEEEMLAELWESIKDYVALFDSSFYEAPPAGKRAVLKGVAELAALKLMQLARWDNRQVILLAEYRRRKKR